MLDPSTVLTKTPRLETCVQIFKRDHNRVILSATTIAPVLHMRIPDAAKALGVSHGSLRLACRKLGIAWPRGRRPHRQI